MPLAIEFPATALESFQELPQVTRDLVREHLARLAESGTGATAPSSFVVTGSGYVLAVELLPGAGKLVIHSIRTVLPLIG